MRDASKSSMPRKADSLRVLILTLDVLSLNVLATKQVQYEVVDH